MTSTQNGQADKPAAVPQQRRSERFSSTEGEIVVFRSSDNVLFNIHRANLRAVTDGPFAEDFVSSETDIADLTENSDILEIIFQFVYPGHLPLLDALGSDLLFSLAEAAEKYRVAPAMAVCYLQIRKFYMVRNDFALQKMRYAYRHGYVEFMDEVAPRTLRETSQNALEIMGAGILYIAWTLYKEAWIKIVTNESYSLRIQNDHGLQNVKCEAWASLVYAVERSLGEVRVVTPHLVRVLFHGKEKIADECKHSHPMGMTHCRHQLALWKGIVEEEAKKVPPFSHFVSSVSRG
ncbi:uncharacterized protein SCHCODRAFT_01176383 [Schizophyllum commune H4-8]|nr:uncharacterized protein SCHCODRAFT_01176383 [Schizophyllum commune H4-8]KAI5886311.1 hypothetical protein SCHCODRAFT_01176383 [Schizophyllum commune H4-8]